MSTRPSLSASLSTPWPVTAHWGEEGLEIGGIPVTSLADSHGTPLLVIDEEHLRRRSGDFREAFPQVMYAVKALTSRRLLQLVACEGLQVLAASGGELDASLRAGIAPTHIALHGNNKTDAELRHAIRAGIALLICDHLEEIERANAIAERLGVRQDVLLRVIPEVVAGGHRFITTGDSDSKFGLSMGSGQARVAVERVVASRGLRFRGLHAHIGSQILSPEPYLTTIDTLAAFAGHLERYVGVSSDVFDLGGGFGITYVDEDPVDVHLLAGDLLDRLSSACRRRGIGVPCLIVEPGRAIVGNAGVTLYRVGAVKQDGHGARIVAVDGGMSDNVRPMLYGARYAVAPAAPARRSESIPVKVVGKHCESGDILADGVEVPASLGSGDVLVVAATGAYCYSMASTYNRTPRPAVVAVRQRRAEVWLRRETYDDLDRLEPHDEREEEEARVSLRR